MSVGESFGSHSLHSFAEFLQHHINSPEASSCLSSKRKPLKPLNVLKPFSLKLWLQRNQQGRVAESVVEKHPEICQMNSQNCTRQILKRITISARPESNGFEDIGQNNGSNTGLWPRNMLRKMPSSDRGETSYKIIFNPGLEKKPLNKASIPAWSVGHSLQMHNHRHYYGVVTTIYLSATSSFPQNQRSRTRRLWV